MKVQIIQQINLTNKILYPGEIIEIPATAFPKLGGRVKLLIEGKHLPNYCRAADAWCSERVKDYPKGCIASNCEHHQGAA